MEIRLFLALYEANMIDGLCQQFPIREVGTRVDFAYPWEQIAIYCDGHDFHERTKSQAKRDRRQDRTLARLCWIPLRFTGSEIHNNIDRLIAEIKHFLNANRMNRLRKELKNAYRYPDLIKVLDSLPPDTLQGLLEKTAYVAVKRCETPGIRTDKVIKILERKLPASLPDTTNLPLLHY